MGGSLYLLLFVCAQLTIWLSTGLDTVDLLDKLLILDPSRRITAAAALDHDWFWSDPMPADPKTYVWF